MRVILLERIKNLGNFGDTVEVRGGYGRYLIPIGLAIAATKANMEHFEQQKQLLLEKSSQKKEAAVARQQQLQDVIITVSSRAAEDGKLYGSVGIKEIAESLHQLGHDVAKKEILLPDGAFHHIGQYSVAIQFHSEVQTTVALHIVAV